MLVEAYEVKHMPLAAPNPIAMIEYLIESRGLARRDLEPYIGSRTQSLGGAQSLTSVDAGDNPQVAPGSGGAGRSLNPAL